jgi:hypothetical protein
MFGFKSEELKKNNLICVINEGPYGWGGGTKEPFGPAPDLRGLQVYSFNFKIIINKQEFGNLV